MLLENYLIRRFLLRVKKLYLYMYMYLSDRIRRMFLSGACPQNLSPKKPLSSKDQRFLQKTKADQNLTRILVKEQKLLYKKHIGLLLQGSVLKAATAYSNSKNKDQQNIKEVIYMDHEKGENNLAIPIYWQVSSKAQKTIKTRKITGLGTLQKKPEVLALPSDHRESFSDNIWKACSNYNFPRKSLTLFVQSIKVQKKISDLKKQEAKNEKKETLEINIDFNEKGKNKNVYISKFDSHALLFQATAVDPKDHDPSDHGADPSIDPKDRDPLDQVAFLALKDHDLQEGPKPHDPRELAPLLGSTQASIACPKGALVNPQEGPKPSDHTRQALLSPGKSKYTNCRYLYDHESLKTCIVPQLFKNQKPISRAKTLLHERKKIALLYGQLAKKDILNISRKAVCIPGFFEDNMFTLLESRVDVCVFRAGFSKTIAGARQLIRNGSVLVNGKKISSCKRRAKPGDYFTFSFKQAFYNPYRYTTLELYHLCLSSNFYREWVSMNKMKFFRENFQVGFETKKKEGKKNKTKTNKICPQWLLFQFFAVRFTEHYKPAFCHSLYWGFFLYKLYKIPSFSCFFETKRKDNILLHALKKRSSNDMASTPGALSLDPFKQAFFDQSLDPKDHGAFVDPKGLDPKDHDLQEGPKPHDPRKLCSFKKKKKYNSKAFYSSAGSLGSGFKQAKACIDKALQSTPGITFEKKTQKAFCNHAVLPLIRRINAMLAQHNHHKHSLSFSFFFCKKKKIVLLNLYTQLLLKKLKNLKTKQKKIEPYFLFRKNIPSSNLWAVWGQKPLHLEISHKTGSFIYMYKPQKIISPVCLNFKP